MNLAQQTYKSLPGNVEVSMSPEGTPWLISKDFIQEGDIVGLSHIIDIGGKFYSGIIPTPLGAFLIHSKKPNCMVIISDKYYTLWTIRDIFVHEVLTVDYELNAFWT